MTAFCFGNKSVFVGLVSFVIVGVFIIDVEGIGSAVTIGMGFEFGGDDFAGYGWPITGIECLRDGFYGQEPCCDAAADE